MYMFSSQDVTVLSCSNFAFDFQIWLRFRPKLSLHVRPKVQLRSYKLVSLVSATVSATAETSEIGFGRSLE